MNHTRTREWIVVLFVTWVAATMALLVTGFALKPKQEKEPEPPFCSAVPEE